MTREPEILISVRAPILDARGAIQNLIDAPFGSAAVISSVKGAIRANHYHATDYHYCWLQRGRLRYYQRPVGSDAPPACRIIEAGELYYTPPRYEHAMLFLEDSVFFVFSKHSRDMAHYEADTVRIPSIVPAADSP